MEGQTGWGRFAAADEVGQLFIVMLATPALSFV